MLTFLLISNKEFINHILRTFIRQKYVIREIVYTLAISFASQLNEKRMYKVFNRGIFLLKIQFQIKNKI